MNKKDYWKKRAEQRIVDAEQQELRFENEIKEYMREAESDMETQIARLYMKYASDNEMSYQETLIYLTNNQREEFQRDVEYYISRSQNPYFRKEYREYLQALSTRARVKRLEVFKVNLHYTANNTYAQINKGTTNLFNNIANDTYNKTIFDIQQFDGFGKAFNKLPDNTLQALLEYPWSGANFSEKIWGNVENFEKRLGNVLTKGMIQGKSNQEISKDLKDITGKTKQEATRLVRTETNYICNQATNIAYTNYGVEEYEYLATLDTKTSEICAELDGQHYPVDKAIPGENYPPMHPYCRSTTIPYFTDNEGTRVARDVDGKTYNVPSTMKYKDWYEQYVKNNPEELKKEKMLKNEHSDKQQFEKYKEILGSDAPKSFAKFQDLKYNKAEEYNVLKSNYKEVKNAYIETIDIKDKTLIQEKIKAFENKVIHDEVENAYIITKKGEIYEFKGKVAEVHPEVLNSKLRNAIITHNHPIGETNFSFSHYDINMFLNFELKELQGFDEMFKYRILRTTKTLVDNSDIIAHKFGTDYYRLVMDKAYKGEINMDDEYHEILKLFADDYKFVYERKLINE